MRRRFLILETDPGALAAAFDSIHAAGHSVASVLPTTLDVPDWIGADRADALLMAISPTDLSGLVSCAKLIAALYDIPVIMAVPKGCEFSTTVQGLSRQSRCTVMEKPYSTDGLRVALEAAIANAGPAIDAAANDIVPARERTLV